MENHDNPIHETDHATIRRFRIFYWIIMIVGVLAFAILPAFLAEIAEVDYNSKGAKDA